MLTFFLLFNVVGLALTLTIVYPNGQWWGPVVTRFRTSQREVWLTIDDGPHPVDTPLILDVLDRYEARATFFVIGRHVAQHPELIREILRRGHTVGNHTMTHPVATFWAALPAHLRQEIETCSTRLRETVPTVPVTYFRAPVGMANPFLFSVLQGQGLRLIGWSARGYDAVRHDVDGIVERIWRQIQPGAIILFHEGHHASRPDLVHVRSLERLLEKLHQAGYRCVLPPEEAFVDRCF